MGRRHLYLHETIDIVGQGQYDYMAHSGKEPTNVMPDMLTLQGTFFVCAMGGGRWPQVVNIWDVGEAGWQGWAANVDRLNLKRRNAFYGDWWDEASKWRTGGFDRLCGGVPGSPTTPEIAERGVQGHPVRPPAPPGAARLRARLPGRRRRGAGAGVAGARPRAHRHLRGARQPARGGGGVGHLDRRPDPPARRP